MVGLFLVLTDPNRNRVQGGTQVRDQSVFSEALSKLGTVLLFWLFIPILLISFITMLKLFT